MFMWCFVSISVCVRGVDSAVLIQVMVLVWAKEELLLE